MQRPQNRGETGRRGTLFPGQISQTAYDIADVNASRAEGLTLRTSRTQPKLLGGFGQAQLGFTNHTSYGDCFLLDQSPGASGRADATLETEGRRSIGQFNDPLLKQIIDNYKTIGRRFF
jgi:hypothetical protein